MTPTYHHRDITGKKVLVTGGAGFIGSHLVAYFLQHGAAEVRVLDNLSTGYRHNLNEFVGDDRLHFLEGDIRDREACAAACTGVDYITHQAALGSVPRSVKDPVTSNDVNVGGFVTLLQAAHVAGIKRIVYASSSSVYGDEPTLPKVESRTGNLLSPYAVSKAAKELYADVFARLHGMEIVGLRYFNVFGPRQDPSGAYAAVIPAFIDKLLHHQPVYIDGDGGQTRDFTYVANAVQANVRALTVAALPAPHLVCNIAVGERFSVNTLYDELRKLTGSAQQAIHRESRAGDIRNSLADISAAATHLGYQPTVTFAEGLRHTVDFFRSRITG